MSTPNQLRTQVAFDARRDWQRSIWTSIDAITGANLPTARAAEKHAYVAWESAHEAVPLLEQAALWGRYDVIDAEERLAWRNRCAAAEAAQ